MITIITVSIFILFPCFSHRLSPAHVIAGFSKKALSDSLCCSLSNDVIGGFLFICRQLWTTSEGLMVLNPYALHEKVANAWKSVCLFRHFYFLVTSAFSRKQYLRLNFNAAAEVLVLIVCSKSFSSLHTFIGLVNIYVRGQRRAILEARLFLSRSQYSWRLPHTCFDHFVLRLDK